MGKSKRFLLITNFECYNLKGFPSGRNEILFYMSQQKEDGLLLYESKNIFPVC